MKQLTTVIDMEKAIQRLVNRHAQGDATLLHNWVTAIILVSHDVQAQANAAERAQKTG